MFRAMIVAVAFSVVLGPALPAVAQGFSFEGDGLLFGPRLCLLSSASLRRVIGEQGYRDIYLNVRNDDYIQARATTGSWVYLLDVNACTGTVFARQRLRPAR